MKLPPLKGPKETVIVQRQTLGSTMTCHIWIKVERGWEKLLPLFKIQFQVVEHSIEPALSTMERGAKAEKLLHSSSLELFHQMSLSIFKFLELNFQNRAR